MKKILLLLSVVLICFAVGCGRTTNKEIDDESIIFTATSSKLEIDEDTTLEDYLIALREADELTFTGDYSGLGLFITSMNGKANETISSTLNSSEGYSWTVYIDFLDIDGVLYAVDSATVTYKGKTLYKANYGVSYIPCLEGHTYAFVYEYYNFTW